jgi:hypothetical protein
MTGVGATLRPASAGSSQRPIIRLDQAASFAHKAEALRHSASLASRLDFRQRQVGAEALFFRFVNHFTRT